MNKLLRGLLTFVHLAFIISLLLLSVDLNCFNKRFYAKEYEKLDTAASIGMSQEDLDRTTEVLLDYIQDKRDDMVVTAVINGEEREVFNERESAHMIDVKNLYLRAMIARNIFIVMELLAVGGVLLSKKRETVKEFCSAFKTAAISFCGILCFLMLYALIDFDSFWRSFHQVFFTNDLWLLDPRVDIMIMMVPLQFFYDLVMRIAIMFIVLFVLVSIIFKVFDRKRSVL